jgi:hypothetical protein
MRPLSGKALFCDNFPYLRSKALKVAIVTRVFQVVKKRPLIQVHSQSGQIAVVTAEHDHQSRFLIPPLSFDEPNVSI